MAQIDPKDFEKWLKWVDDGLRLSLRDPVKSEILGFGFHQKSLLLRVAIFEDLLLQR